MKPCPCNSNKDFADCCSPYLSGQAQAPTALALMRSRYTAYVNGEFDYLLDTWHPDKRDSAADFAAQAGIRWQGLEILTVENGAEDDSEGMVEFQVKFETEGQSHSMHERSTFVREDGRWYYVSGKIMPVRSAKTGRNEPCPCGSGKKFKKCCMK